MVSQVNADVSKITLLKTCNSFNNIIPISFKILGNISQINDAFLLLSMFPSSNISFGL